jgi:hypothetical protein
MKELIFLCGREYKPQALGPLLGPLITPDLDGVPLLGPLITPDLDGVLQRALSSVLESEPFC